MLGALAAVDLHLTSTNVIPIALVYGVGSAFVPIINAEVFVAAAVAALKTAWWWPVIALAVGQTIGKCILFMGARKGTGWLTKRHTKEPKEPDPDHPPAAWRVRIAMWSKVMLTMLDRPMQGFAVVLASSAIGIPPLAIVSIVAGTRKTPFNVFLVACLIGRVGRFLALAWPIAVAANRA